MDTKAKSSPTADNVYGLVWESTPMMIRKFFAVAYSPRLWLIICWKYTLYQHQKIETKSDNKCAV
eukprot:1145922-Pelagomonas_calceolata.AAC.5